MAEDTDLVDGAFAGVRVYWPGSDLEFGQRNAIHVLPDGDEIHVKALGEMPDRRQVEFFTIGPNWMLDRNRVEAALRKPGPHQMTDPWWGTSTVEVKGSARVTHSTQRGGMATFSFTAVKAIAFDFPIVPEPAANVKVQAINLKAALEASLASKLSLGQFKGAVRGALALAAIAMSIANGKVNSALGVISDTSNGIDAFDSQLNTLIQSPQQLANTMQGLWDSIVQVTLDIKDSAIPFGLDDGAGRLRGDADPLGTLEDVTQGTQAFDSGADDVSAERRASVGGADLLADLEAVEFTVKGQALASVCETLADMVPDDAQFANEFKDQMVGWFETLAEYPTTVEEQQALADLKAAVIDYLVTEGIKAPDVTTVNVARYTPALVLAYRFYGDATRDQDIIRRNTIQDPMRVRGEIRVVLG